MHKHIKWSHLRATFQLEQRSVQSLQVHMRTARTCSKYETNTKQIQNEYKTKTKQIQNKNPYSTSTKQVQSKFKTNSINFEYNYNENTSFHSFKQMQPSFRCIPSFIRQHKHCNYPNPKQYQINTLHHSEGSDSLLLKKHLKAQTYTFLQNCTLVVGASTIQVTETMVSCCCDDNTSCA